MKRYASLIFILILLAGVYTGYSNQDGKIADNYPFEKALKLSQILDRQFIFSFVQEGCSLCEEFKTNILTDSEVKEVLNKHFVFSLVPVDETFEIELPEKGKVTNIQLASGLGVKGTPTTFIFYPPGPGLLQEGRFITEFGGPPPDPESLIDFLKRMVTEDFDEENKDEKGNETSFYNYKPPIKSITVDDLALLKETSLGIPIISEKLSLSSLPEGQELIVSFTDNKPREYGERIISETEVKKVYLVKSQDD